MDIGINASAGAAAAAAGAHSNGSPVTHKSHWVGSSSSPYEGSDRFFCCIAQVLGFKSRTANSVSPGGKWDGCLSVDHLGDVQNDERTR